MAGHAEADHAHSKGLESQITWNLCSTPDLQGTLYIGDVSSLFYTQMLEEVYDAAGDGERVHSSRSCAMAGVAGSWIRGGGDDRSLSYVRTLAISLISDGALDSAAVSGLRDRVSDCG